MLSAMLLVAATAAAPAPISYQVIPAGRASYHWVTADMRREAITVGTAFSPHLADVWSFIKREQPAVAITGTFFSPQSQKPVGDVVRDGKIVAHGWRGSAVAVDYFGRVHIVDTRYQQAFDWLSFRAGVRGVVRVVSNGKVAPNPQAQKFKDKRIWGRAARTAVGITKQGKLVLVATKSPVTLSELGNAMVGQGVVDAVSLDGGSSTCLYYRGNMVVAPGRKLSNMLVLHERPPY